MNNFLVLKKVGMKQPCPWKPNHPPLLSNRNGSLQRLNSLLRKFNPTGVIRDQIEQKVVEKAQSEAVGKEFYLPHRAVVRGERTC